MASVEADHGFREQGLLLWAHSDTVAEHCSVAWEGGDVARCWSVDQRPHI
jgi:hypothetical protein